MYNPNAIRSSQGSVFTVPLAASDSGEVYSWLKANGINMYAAMPGEGLIYTSVDFKKASAVVFGSEHKGVSGIWKNLTPVNIPMKGKMDSLNVAQTATLVAYEALRQKSL